MCSQSIMSGKENRRAAASWVTSASMGLVVLRVRLCPSFSPSTSVLAALQLLLLAGKFESGARVAGALLSQTVAWTNATGSPVPPPQGFDPSLPHAELGLLALHDGDVIAPLETTVVCGLPRHKRGLVFDAWRLVQPWEMTPGQ